jgi:hypothetical protein
VTDGFKLTVTPVIEGNLPGWEAEGYINGHDFTLFGSSIPATLRGVAHLVEDLGRPVNYVEN